MERKLTLKLQRTSLVCIALIVALVPFHAFLTVFGSSLVGHYTALRLWEEVLLVPPTLYAAVVLVRDPALRGRVARSWLWRLIAGYALLTLIAAAVAAVTGSVSMKALGYGVLIDLRFLLFCFVTWIVAEDAAWFRLHWRRLVLVPAAVVAVVALLQRFVVPHDFLRHFGYGDTTIPPFETIDHKVQYLRVQSTLRGANLLGAYLIIVTGMLTTMFIRSARRWRLAAALTLAFVVLFLSGSRGAWVGSAVSMAVVLLCSLPGRHRKELVLAGGTALIVVLAGGLLVLRHNDFVQNTFFHTDEHSRSSESSNAAHFSASWAALKQIGREPLGRGPGSAGPASVYNGDGQPRIAEDYFLQIGQETGWLGMGLFIAIIAAVGHRLWRLRADPLALSLLASLAGITCMALLMHIWADETIAFLFWGLTGFTLAAPDGKK